jgi:hypothetical protein
MHLISDEIIQVEFEEDIEWMQPSAFKNVFIAAITTAHARIKLYSLLDMLQERVLYCDTDSVVFTERKGEKSPPLGNYLGELTSELEHGDHITEFISTGPKAYSYSTKHGHTVTKLKGFTLNYKNSLQINFESMKNVLFHNEKITVTNENKITRDKRTFEIYNVHEEKQYKMLFDKRVLMSDYHTLPYGY